VLGGNGSKRLEADSTTRFRISQTSWPEAYGRPGRLLVCHVLSSRLGRTIPTRAKASGAAWGSIRTAWDNAVAAARIVDFHYHDLRHTFASHFMMRGGNVAELREILGHADIKMTMRYSHLSPAHLRAAVDKLAGLTPSKRQEINTTSAHGVKSERQEAVSPR
jgi:hypothetical protein